MPVYKTFFIHFDHKTWAKIMIWKITESVQELSDNLLLTTNSKNRLVAMKSEAHQKGFLAVRKLMIECSLLDKDLYYNEHGRPLLKKDFKISISHSHNFAVIAISNTEIGIDIERNREKIISIADKFCDLEFEFLNKVDDHYIEKLTTIWAVKEAIFKIENQKGISFKNHISVKRFEISDKNITANLNFSGKTTKFELQALPIENFTLVYGTKII
jgi:phosphopantetheinyl transferase